ncbi:MAG: dienelactone hydrolase family protein [Actinomycetes bacterium]
MRTTLANGVPAELALPPTRDDNTLGVVLFPDIMGLRPLFDDMCAQLAADHGWVVCAPEPFPGRENLPVDERLGVMADFDDAELRQTAVLAADATGCDRVVATGFCMGGMLAFKAAASGRFDRAAGFYGMIRLPETWAGGRLQEPIEALASADRCPTLAIIGTADHFTPPQDVADAEALGVVIVSYEGAEHGFVHDASRPAHRPEDAADAWRRVVEFLES